MTSALGSATGKQLRPSTENTNRRLLFLSLSSLQHLYIPAVKTNHFIQVSSTFEGETLNPGEKSKKQHLLSPSLPAAQLNGSYLPQRQTTPSAHRWTLASVFTIDKADRMGDKALLKCPSNSFKVQPSITFFKPVVPSGVRKTSPESEDTQATIGHSSRALCVAKHHHA